MHLTDAPAEPARLPCIRDYHELLRDHLPAPAVVKLAPLPELARCLNEIVAEHPRFREEAPLILVGEERRRQRLSGQLHVVGRPTAAAFATNSRLV